MEILITNDDGIDSKGLLLLARAASGFGNVTVIAPPGQSSAMSHHVTFHRDMKLCRADFGAEKVTAYTLDGTPADCIRASFLGMLDFKADVVMTGINDGANTGFDILYSATVGAGMEALLYKVPAFCFSMEFGGCFEVVEKHLENIIAELLNRENVIGELWNVNFPACEIDECRGVLYGRKLSQQAYFDDNYSCYPDGDKGRIVKMETVIQKGAEPDTDMQAIFDNYISIGKVKNPAMT